MSATHAESLILLRPQLWPVSCLQEVLYILLHIICECGMFWKLLDREYFKSIRPNVPIAKMAM